jgi:hypothetical protein
MFSFIKTQNLQTFQALLKLRRPSAFEVSIFSICDKIERSVLSQQLPLVSRCSSASFLN